MEGGVASWPFGGGHPSVPALDARDEGGREGGREGGILSTVCAATVVTVLNYPHGGSYERDDSNARCNEERITDGFIPFSGRVRASYILRSILFGVFFF